MTDDAKTPPEKSSALDPVWKFFSSVHVAVIILILLAAISIIGTVIQQGEEATEDNLRLFHNLGLRLGVGSPEAFAEKFARFTSVLGWDNLYHTWYFYVLLGMLCTSLAVCSLRRLPLTWKAVRHNEVEREDSFYRASPQREGVRLALPRGAAADAVGTLLRKAGYAVQERRLDGADHFFGQKGAYSRFGIYLTHFSIIVVLLGGVTGSILGFKGYMQIVEGSAEKEVTLRGAKRERLVLPFEVRCDNFEVETYAGTGRPKDYFSDLTVLKGGREMVKKRIEVNDPLQFEGIWFYQSNYGETGRGLKARILARRPGTSAGRELQFSGTEARVLPDLGVTLQLLQVVPDFAMEGGQVVSKSNQPRNPAAMVRVTTADGKSRNTWLFSLRPDIKLVADLPVDLTFLGFDSLQYTGLQVVYDPAVWVIWVGCTIMTIGLIFAFFVSHRRVWARVREEEGSVVVSLAGNANKNRDSFAEDFRKLARELEAAGGAPPKGAA